jgi:CRISPR-associated protein Csx3
MKVVLCGPPQSGKSCLREGLKQAIRQIKGAAYPYAFSACPDGEGAWFAETARRNLQEARQYKENYKSPFTLEFATVRAQWVRDSKEPLTIVDVGGRIDEKNRLIMQYATHAVILAGEMSEVPAWWEFCTELKLKIIAVIHSDYHGVCDQLCWCAERNRVESEVPILRGSVHYLERGEDVSTRPMVQALARVLVGLSRV